jgi:hypothetical protein
MVIFSTAIATIGGPAGTVKSDSSQNSRISVELAGYQ